MTKKPDPFGKPKDNEDEFSVDATEVTSGGFRIEPGNYPAKIISVAAETSKAGNPMYVWTFALIGDKYPGREFKTWTVTTPQALWKVCEILEAVGIEAFGKRVAFKKADVINKQLMLRIKDEAGQDGEMRSVVGKTDKHPDGPVSKKALPK